MTVLSRYVFLFQRDGRCFLFNSRTNSFYVISEEAYHLLCSIKNGIDVCLPIDFLENLRKRNIMVSESQDDRYRDYLKISYLKSAYKADCLSLTIVPTMMCNLRCPYCFEESKPKGIMNDETIDNLIKFIKTNARSKKVSITWFGGEPLLGIHVIEKILKKIDKDEGLELISHSIVTNGTLLNAEAREIFKRYPLDSMQITFDGLQQSHDSKRCFESGEGSFDIILRNCEDFLSDIKDTTISFRVNIDNNNKNEYLSIHNFLLGKFKGYSISVYPALLRANRGCENETFMTSEDHLEFSSSLWRNKVKDMYPSKCSKGCCATSISSYIVGPGGELYVCWEHVGNSDKIMGSIDGDYGLGMDLYALYKLKGHCFDDPKCMSCGLLPLCNGGCADKRVGNMINGENNNLCSIYNEKDHKGLEDALYEYFLYEDKQQ